MRKISLLIAAVSALMISCSSPYYPEYVPVISLGASTNNLICEKEEGIASLSVLSNTDYTATLVSGNDWVRFAEEDPAVRNGHGNDVLEFVINANNHDKRVAELVLAVGDYKKSIKIKQKGCFDDYLDIHPDDKANKLTLMNNTRMQVSVKGGDFKLRLYTSCLDQQLKVSVDHDTAVSSSSIENKTLHFTISENEEGQPRIVNITLSYVDGWGDTQSLTFSFTQGYQE